jgi:transcriptional regulator with XRE-family HTH domain
VAADWVLLGTDEMKEARARLGLSYEEVARRVSKFGYEIRAKTYERWEQRGMVRKPALRPVTSVLGIEVDEPDPIRVKIDGLGLTSSERQQLVEVLGHLNDSARYLIQLLDTQQEIADAQQRTVAQLERVAAAIQRREASNS